jgi:hypothetical protein
MRGNKREHGRPHPTDEPQVVAWKVPVKKIHWRGHDQDAGFAEALKRERVQLGQRDGLRQLQLPLIRFKRVLVKLGDVPLETGGAG